MSYPGVVVAAVVFVVSGFGVVEGFGVVVESPPHPTQIATTGS